MSIPAAEAGYPYPLKALWLHMGTPAYSSSGRTGEPEPHSARPEDHPPGLRH